MAADRHIYSEIDSKADMKKVYTAIRGISIMPIHEPL